MKWQHLKLSLLSLLLLVPSALAYAADATSGAPDATGASGTGLTNPLGSTTTLTALLTSILTFITTSIGPVIVTLMLVYCGFLFVMAQGKEAEITKAKDALMWTVIGALILLGAVVIQSVITGTVNAL